MQRLFDDFAGRRPMGTFTGRGWPSPLVGWTTAAPAVNIPDLEQEIRVRAELPGMEEKDLNVEIVDDTLTIRGETNEEREDGENEGLYYLSDRRYGAFERSLRIPPAHPGRREPRQGGGAFQQGGANRHLPQDCGTAQEA